MAVPVSVRYDSSSLFISLPLFTKVHKTTTWNSHILDIRKSLNYTTANFYSFYLEFWSYLAYSVWDISDSIDKLNKFIQILAKFVDWILSRLSLALLPLLLKLLFAGLAANKRLPALSTIWLFAWWNRELTLMSNSWRRESKGTYECCATQH